MDIQKLKAIVGASSNIVFFGGAGTSTESGIPDFRSQDGLYNSEAQAKYTPEDMLSRWFFMHHTEEFYQFYKTRMIYPEAKPHTGHYALAVLERRGQLKGIITQNIDGLHQLAGNDRVLELHGSVHRNYCMKCKAFYTLDDILSSPERVPSCSQCGGVIKPDVVLYQESLDDTVIQASVQAISNADVLIVAGTSLTVQPAAGLIRLYRGSNLVLINKSATPMDGLADYTLKEPIAKVLEALI